MNQRASHFVLGSNTPAYGSIYTKDYPPKEAQADSHKINNPFRGTSLNNDQKSSFNTTNKAMLKAWEHPERAQLDPQKMAQLRGHHFNLGSYNPREVITTHKLFYDKKEISG